MSEDQNIEWKASWRDEYLKWISGFANAQGGLLEIGRNNKGVAVGLDDAARLMEELPNKIRDILGILPEVNLLKEDDQEVIQISVEPYPHPVSHKGKYYQRIGSTNQELKGAALDHFLLRKIGKRWDAVPLPGVAVSDLDTRAIERFRELGARSKRLDPVLLEENVATLIEKLRLTDGRYLKRAAVLLFHPDPEAFVTGAYIKIGYWESDSDVRYHDEIHGDLFTQVDKTMDLLLTKYLKALISYEGLVRIETYPVPESALREALLNAVAHKDYAGAAPIQISVYEDKILFWNNGRLHEDWTVDSLLSKHASQPFNPDIANAFFRSGMIEAWGRGIERMRADCVDEGVPEPELRFERAGLWVEFRKRVIPDEETPYMPGKMSDKILTLMAEDPSLTISDMISQTGKSDRTVRRAIRELREAGLLERVGPAIGGKWHVIGVDNE